MYYKVKVNQNNIQVISTVKRAGKDGEFLYLTQDEIDMLSPDALVGYKPSETDINKLNKRS